MIVSSIANLGQTYFTARKNEYSVPYGVDYSLVDEFKTNDYSKSELAVAAIDGRLTLEMINEMVLDRVPKTIKHAQRFVLEHPELDKDEVTQQLISYVVELAHKYKGQSKGNFNNYAYQHEGYFLQTLVDKKTKEDDWYVSGVDLKSIKDNQLNLDLRNLLACDVQSSVSMLDTWEEDVIRKRYGLDGDEPKTLEVCADEFNVSSERVGQGESAAMRHLRSPYRLFDILEDISYLKNGDELDKRALLLDRNIASE